MQKRNIDFRNGFAYCVGPGRAHTALYGSIWAHMGPYGPIWAQMGPYGSSWTGLGFPYTFRKLSVRQFGPISHVSGPKLVF